MPRGEQSVSRTWYPRLCHMDGGPTRFFVVGGRRVSGIGFCGAVTDAAYDGSGYLPAVSQLSLRNGVFQEIENVVVPPVLTGRGGPRSRGTLQACLFLVSRLPRSRPTS